MTEVIVETDFLTGLIHRSDRLHKTCLEILDRYRVYLSPYSLIEYRLVNIHEAEYETWIKVFKYIDLILRYYNIRILPSNPIIHVYSMEYRVKYNMSLFDSMHAGSSKYYDLPLLSSDKVYGKVSDIKWIPLEIT